MVITNRCRSVECTWRKTTWFSKNITTKSPIQLQSFIIKLILNYKSLKVINQSLGAMIPDQIRTDELVRPELRNTALRRDVLPSIKMCKLQHRDIYSRFTSTIKSSNRICWRACFCCTCMCIVHHEMKLNYCLEHTKMFFHDHESPLLLFVTGIQTHCIWRSQGQWLKL